MPGHETVKYKALHLAKTLEELNERVDKDGIITNANPKALIKSIEKLYSNGELAERVDKDDEIAYMYYMRFIQAISAVNKDKNSDKNIIQSFKSRVSIALERSDILSDRLKQRYDLLQDYIQAEEKVIRLELLAATEVSNVAQKSKPLSNGLITTSNTLVRPVLERDITPDTLKNLIDQKATSFLLIDTRSPADFNSSHPKHPNCICISNLILVKGKSANQLTKMISQTTPESLDLWDRRSTFDLIILYDWNSSFESMDKLSPTPISALYDSITQWDINTKYHGPIKILQGGIRHFYHKYPTYFTNPGTVVEEANTKSTVIPIKLDSISYPSLLDDPLPLPLPPVVKIELLERRSVVNVPWKEERENKDLATEDDRYEYLKKLREEKKHIVEGKPTNEGTLSSLINGHVNNNGNQERLELEEPPKVEKKEELLPPIRNPSIPRPSAPKPNLQLNPISSNSSGTTASERPSSEQVPPKAKYTEKIKPDTEQQRANSALKRSHSNPNLAQHSFEDKEPPSYSRTQKPQSRREFSTISSTQRSHRTGLKNLGNTCYMNSIVQCLSHTRLLTDFLTSEACRRHVNMQGGTRGDVTKELAMTIQQLHVGHRSIVPEELKRVIGRYHGNFSGYGQQDSHELLTLMLDWMNEELNKVKVKVARLEQKNDGIPDEEGASIAWEDYLSSYDSKISELFLGQQKSCVRCQFCGKESVTFEPFLILSIPIPSTTRCTLNQCMDLYTSSEEVPDWRCVHCKKSGRAIKKIDLWRLPQYLIIHLQRFYNNDGYWRKRINEVDCPLENLDLFSRVKEPRNGDIRSTYNYDLYAISNHYGSMEGGHYTAFCKNQSSWTKFDDSDVTTIIPREVCTTAAYILFYQNSSTGGLS